MTLTDSLPDPAALIEAFDSSAQPELVEQWLRPLHFQDPASAAANLQRLYHAFLAEQFTRLAPGLLRSVVQSADPDRALRNWARFIDSAFDPFGFGHRLAGNPEMLRHLSVVFGFSQFMSDILIRFPEYLDWLLAPGVLGTAKPLEAYRREGRAAVELFDGAARRRQALCRYQTKEMLRIGVRESLRHGALMERTGELSDLAQAVVEIALEECRERLQAKYGRPLREDEPGRVAEFAVVAMGKFGGRELNFSSDVDLIFYYSAEGDTEGGEDRRRVSNHEYFSRLGEALIGNLSLHDETGFLYRVDMRLRPEGGNGPLARSMASMEQYYFSQARSWERMAMIKARPFGGDEPLRRAFETMAREFVFGMFVSPQILQEFAGLKTRIDSQVEDRGHSGREIKRGEGGIREIEFVVGALQILLGAKHPELQTRGTLEALSHLQRLGYVPNEDATVLRVGYEFLRDVEHRLQMLDLKQTHTLPEDPLQMEALARRQGFERGAAGNSREAFLAELGRVRTGVHRIFRLVFGKNDAPPPTGIGSLLDPSATDEVQFDALRPYRFSDPAILDAFRSLAFGHRDVYLSPEGQQFFEKILPRFVEECSRAPFPEQAVRYFDSFLMRFKGIAATLAFIAEQPDALRALILLLGASEYFGRVLIGHPEYLDALVDSEALASVPTRESLAKRTAGIAERSESEEAMQASLVRFKDIEYLMAGIRDLEGWVAQDTTAATLSDVAQACVAGAHRFAGLQLWRSSGLEGEPAGLAVIAMGKLGTGEMNYFSDLDLVFVHGEAPQGVREEGDFFARWAQSIVAILSGVTPAGILYKVDARLRPEGKSAPLAAPVSRYRDYYETRAEVWEFQSLIRSRHVAGDEPISNALREAAAGPMARVSQRETLAAEIRSMRGRIEAAVNLPRAAALDFKRSRGGVVDLEFIVQYLQLRGFAQHADLFTPGFEGAVERLERHGLIAAPDAALLRRNYRFLRLLESRARLLFANASNYLPENTARLEPLAFALRESLAGETSLLEAVRRTMEENRRLFDALVRA